MRKFKHLAAMLMVCALSLTILSGCSAVFLAHPIEKTFLDIVNEVYGTELKNDPTLSAQAKAVLSNIDRNGKLSLEDTIVSYTPDNGFYVDCTPYATREGDTYTMIPVDAQNLEAFKAQIKATYTFAKAAGLKTQKIGFAYKYTPEGKLYLVYVDVYQ